MEVAMNERVSGEEVLGLRVERKQGAMPQGWIVTDPERDDSGPAPTPWKVTVTRPGGAFSPEKIDFFFDTKEAANVAKQAIDQAKDVTITTP